MLSRLHLVRHGEVHNPEGVVYARLPGFHLSELGRLQAQAAARHLQGEGIAAIVASPLERARETADLIAAQLGLAIDIDERLTEWGIADRWVGVEWSRIEERFPGELSAYATKPHDLPFSPESVSDLADRMESVVERLVAPAAILVSHQDPIQALRLRLTGKPLATLQADKPGHAAVVTLRLESSGWAEEEQWSPDLPSAPFPPLEG